MKKEKLRFGKALMLATSVLVMTGFTLIAVYSTIRLERIVLVNKENDMTAVVEQANQSLEQVWGNLCKQGDSLSKNSNFIDALLLKKNGNTVYQRQINELQVEKELQNLYTSGNNIDNLIFYDDLGIYYASRKNVAYYRDILPNADWFSPVLSGETMQVSRYNVWPAGMSIPVHVFAQRLLSSTDGSYLGTLTIITPMDVFSNVVNGLALGESGIGILLSETGEIEYMTQAPAAQNCQPPIKELLAGSNSSQDDRSLYMFRGKEEQPYPHVAAFLPSNVLTEDARNVRREMIAVSIVICGLIVLALRETAQYLTKPLVEMCREMDRVSSGELNVAMEDQPYFETSTLVSHFNRMVEQLQTLMGEVRKAEHDKQRLEMEVLEAQVNPHFIYNTLEAIKWMAIAQKSPNIPQIITALVKLLTTSISVKTKTVTLKEELDYLRQYLLLMEFRYNCKYAVTYQVEAEVMEAETVKMVLQPLVENAIFHGFSNKSGKIWITACRQENDLLIEIRDNGIGFDKTPDAVPHRRTFTGIGTENINSRIHLQYGQKYGLKLWSKRGEGTSVMIRQPFRVHTPEKEGADHDSSVDC